jgi:Fe2+ or Zn2+ uptake regulation protein
MKYSRQRELILETLKAAKAHPTADEIYTQAKKHMQSISLGTVYRNLNLLVELGTIRKLESPGTTSVRYDGRNDEHCHLVCTSCGTITDFDLSLLTQVDANLKRKTGFTVREHGVVLKGMCATCTGRKNSLN